MTDGSVLSPAPGCGVAVFDAEAEARVRAALPDGLSRPLADLAARAGAAAPYLARLMAKRPDTLLAADAEGAAAVCARATQAVSALEGDADSVGEGLRRAKQAVHLACALADLSGAWTMDDVVGALTAFADAAVARALKAAAGAMPLDGFAVLALGKMGAGELNYSSDVDVLCLFDPACFVGRGEGALQADATRLAKRFSQLLQAPTAEGYVFRVDLRLRPDPAATPPAVSLDAARVYYETRGMAWERAAFIRARPCAGDPATARLFLARIAKFVWRRRIDFAAREDLRAIQDQLQAGAEEGLAAPGADIKRDPGGIRPIEFFVHANQLLFGGRRQALRVRGTRAALMALSDAGHLPHAQAERLADDYARLRALEHRLQMVEDAHTHTVPADPQARRRAACLSGEANLALFDAQVAALRTRVHHDTAGLLGDPPPPDAARVPKPEPAAAVADAVAEAEAEPGEDPDEALAAEIEATLARWREGGAAATRSPRARAALEVVLPDLREAMVQTGDPARAWVGFSTFFERLPAGVAALSLFNARDDVLGDLVRLLTLAPGLATDLGRRPHTLDVMVEPDFAGELDPAPIAAQARAAVEEAASFEEALNAARRAHAEAMVRIGVHVLLRDATAQMAGAAQADLADALIGALLPHARAEAGARATDPGGEVVVLGLGKLGGREIAAGSDLDLMVVYDPADADAGDGFFTKLTQRLIAALSALTEEGRLYEVDMALRPSGSAGPVAVRLSAFERYYAEDAWTWELMALTRARVVAGDPGLGARIEAVRRDVLTRPRDAGALRADIAAMRARVAAAKPAVGMWDLKHAPGGLIDVEFTAQRAQLLAAPTHPDVIAPSTLAALERLEAAGAITTREWAALSEAGRLQLDLTHILRLAAEDASFDPKEASPALIDRLAKAVGATTGDELNAYLSAAQAGARFQP